ncbi:sulfatase-like hydrolase/transferase [Thalassoroseus pseudoceratinae]|uniref:sulfatase-like hydrolase/transferase n=1 Tax=Thalassoroseus pseudoceratinae TaxID=2713176 RepID=UPI00142329D3|nr:sulfatase-like hydrolase/transferase [Thalassoroseus pseudoceratinae]
MSHLVDRILRVPSVLLCLVCGLCLSGCGQQATLFNVAKSAEESTKTESTTDSLGLDSVIDQLQTLSPIAVPAEVQNGLEQANEALRKLERMKRSNREAIRDANRQVRVMNPARSPNIVMIVAPRLAANDLGVYGQEPTITPNLDRMAENGVRFLSFHGASPDPLASRWSLLTGQLPSQADEEAEPRFQLRNSRCNVAETLWQAGYDTGFIGVWGAPDNAPLDTPLNHGFDEWMGVLPYSAMDDPTPDNIWLGEEQPLQPIAQNNAQPGFTAGDLFVRESLRFFRTQRGGRRPFYLQLHLPNYMGYPAALLDRIPPTRDGLGQTANRYAAGLMMMDQDVGRILSGLEVLGLTNRTAVFFTAFTGPDPNNAAALNGLGSLGPYQFAPHGLGQANLQVPLIARFPGFFPTNRLGLPPAVVWDLHPTLAELAWAIQKPTFLPGTSLMPEIYGRRELAERVLYWRYRMAQAARLGPWKAVKSAGVNDVLLYDLVNDPGERTDVAAEHPEIVNRLTIAE